MKSIIWFIVSATVGILAIEYGGWWTVGFIVLLIVGIVLCGRRTVKGTEDAFNANWD